MWSRTSSISACGCRHARPVSPTRAPRQRALKTIVAVPFVLDGHRGLIEIEAHHVRHVIDFGVDRIRQHPTVEHRVEPGNVTAGTRIKVHWPDSVCSILEDAGPQFYKSPGGMPGSTRISRSPSTGSVSASPRGVRPAWSKWKPSDPTSPHWYTAAHFERLVAGYIAHDTDRGRMRTVRELVAEFRGLTAASKTILGSTGLARALLTALANGRDLDHAVVASARAMKINSRPVKPRLLGSIGRDHFKRGSPPPAARWRASTIAGPWTPPTACRGSSRPPSAGARARHAPLGLWRQLVARHHQSFRELGRFGQSLDTILSQQRADQDEPVILVLHMACPRVEYTDRGKSAVVVRHESRQDHRRRPGRHQEVGEAAQAGRTRCRRRDEPALRDDATPVREHSRCRIRSWSMRT